jgi:hypothetical protein
MPVPRLKICSLLALALLVGGCGSSHSASTTTSVASAPTTGPIAPTTGATAPTTGPTQAGGSLSAPPGASGSTQTSTGPTPNPTKPEQKKPLEFKEGANEPEKMRIRARETGVPVKHQYPTSLQEAFTNTCTAAGGSPSACECVLKKLELSRHEKGYSLAELLAVYVGLRRTSYQAIAKGGPVQVPADAFKFMKACQAAK